MEYFSVKKMREGVHAPVTNAKTNDRILRLESAVFGRASSRCTVRLRACRTTRDHFALPCLVCQGKRCQRRVVKDTNLTLHVKLLVKQRGNDESLTVKQLLGSLHTRHTTVLLRVGSITKVRVLRDAST